MAEVKWSLSCYDQIGNRLQDSKKGWVKSVEEEISPNQVSHVGTGIVIGLVAGIWAAFVFSFQMGYGISLGLVFGGLGDALLDVYEKYKTAE